MINLDNPSDWATRIGLAQEPLFGANANVGAHQVLLDGGYGSFLLSVGDGADESVLRAPSWIWSGDIPQHVAVLKDRVRVERWDQRETRTFGRNSIERRFEDFYRFLSVERKIRARRVVEHAVSIFRRLRSLLPESEGGATSVDAFLLLLASIAEQSSFNGPKLAALARSSDLPLQSVQLLLSAPESALTALLSESHNVQVGGDVLKLHPDLAIRHAGGVIFQEAHFDLLRQGGPDLFGYVPEPGVRPTSRGGVHFTPPALARSIVEQAASCLGELATRERIVICDPACGSGVFLIEALRTLRRLKFDGALSVCGRDISPHAVSMARFAIRRASHDWQPRGGIVVDVRVANSLLTDAIPPSDLIIMNPPFVSWTALDDSQRGLVSEILGPSYQGRADLSMAFILRALAALKPEGALGTLFPASLLSLQAASKWRRQLLDQASIRFLASLGEYGLFEYALVQVGAAVFSKGTSVFEMTALWTEDDKTTTGEAFRALRRGLHGFTGSEGSTTDWRIVSVPISDFRRLDTWRVASVANERLFSDIRNAISYRVADVFSVQQGIRTGANDVFILDRSNLSKLGKNEARWFRRAIMNHSIESGRLIPGNWVFYPYRGGELALTSEADLKRQLPNYTRLYLFPNKERLKERAGLENRHWWELTRQRSWLYGRSARIISKYFGERGSFALDTQGEFAVVQGFGWSPAKNVFQQSDLDINSLLAAYTALFNSRIFEQLLAASAPQMAGGQFDLSPRYVDHIPLPNLADDVSDSSLASLIMQLASLGYDPQVFDPTWSAEVDSATARLYRTTLDVWPQQQ